MIRSLLIAILFCTNVFSKDLLIEHGWNKSVKKKLESLILKRKGKGDVVVFDFDNTLICRDIGEATFAQLVKDKSLDTKNISSLISSDFHFDGDKKSLNSINNKTYDLTSYYEDFLSATKHQKGEKTPYLNGYAWVVQIMEGMTPKQIISASKKAFSFNSAALDRHVNKETSIKTPVSSYRRPYFYKEMIELVAQLLKHDYKVYVVSASNVWTVRYMVTKHLNKQLKKYGNSLFIPNQNVIGVSSLLKDRRNGKLYKDQLLIKTNKKYAAMDLNELNNYELSTQIVYPITGYYGKVANIMKHIGKRPYLVAGDSPNDHPMLKYGKNQLWLARLEKTGYQKNTAEFVEMHNLEESWLVQPVLYKKYSGFHSEYKLPDVYSKTEGKTSGAQKILSSLKALTQGKLIK